MDDKIELKNIAINHSSYIDYQDFKKILRKFTENVQNNHIIFWQ